MRWPSFSFSSARGFHAAESERSTPEATRRMEILPVKGSERVLKTSAATGALGSAASWTGWPPRSVAGNAPRSAGEGAMSTRVSSRADGPMPWPPAESVTGKIWRRRTAWRRPLSRSSWDSVPCSKKPSISRSSVSATASISWARGGARLIGELGRDVDRLGLAVAVAREAVGLVVHQVDDAGEAGLAPIGSWMGSTARPKLFCRPARARSKSARSRSILQRWKITGSSISSAKPHTFSVLTSTPATGLTVSSTASAARTPARASVRKMP